MVGINYAGIPAEIWEEKLKTNPTSGALWGKEEKIQQSELNQEKVLGQAEKRRKTNSR